MARDRNYRGVLFQVVILILEYGFPMQIIVKIQEPIKTADKMCLDTSAATSMDKRHISVHGRSWLTLSWDNTVIRLLSILCF
jgi:hypothetical protein